MKSERNERIDSYNSENQYQFFSRQYLTDSGERAKVFVNRQGPGAPDTVSLPHMHGFFEIELVCEGEAEHGINTKRYPLHRGSLHLIRPGDVHQYFFSEAPILMYTVQFEPSVILPALVSEMSLIPAPLYCDAGDDTDALEGMLRILHQATMSQGEHATGMLRCQIEFLTRYILSLVPHVEMQFSPLVREALSIIRVHYYKHLTLEQLARQLHISPEHLGRLFKAELGCGVPDYVNQFRLQIAANLIRTTRYTLRQISVESGYTTYRHFARAFGAYFCMSPGEYRERHHL